MKHENINQNNKRNYQKEMEETISAIVEQKQVPSLLLHSCCAPCSSYVLKVLSDYFRITVLYYNPNIYPAEEYEKRVREQEKFIAAFPTRYPVDFVAGDYITADFYQMAQGLEQEPEGQKRCYKCYEMRLRETAVYAKKMQMDYFTTTLSISPMKNALWLNEIGERLAEEFGLHYLTSDFKKKNGYKCSTELSREYDMYRQNYCGCVYSYKEAELRTAQKK